MLLKLLLLGVILFVGKGNHHVAAACDEGAVSAFATGDAAIALGATDSDTCAEFCVSEFAVSFIPGAAAGMCSAEGYTTLVESDLTVELTGSPMPLSVSIYSSQ